jgi:hypothetical protein
MRRTRFILAFVTAAFAVTTALVGAPAASAHFCAIPAEIKVGQEVMVSIGVAAEEKPVAGVDIEIPRGFALKEPVGFMGYEPTRRGRWVHFDGAEIAPFGCHYFGFSGHATQKGRLVARVITTATDGTRTRYDSLKPAALYPAMVIYAGVTAADFGADESSGTPAWLWPAVAVATGLGAVGIVFGLRRRSAR